MPNDSPGDNKVYCKGYYERMKQDPLKWKAFLEKRSQYKKSRKSVNPVNPRAVSPGKTAQVPCEPPVNPAQPEDPLARIHREYKAECEALGYDVDGNRAAVLAALVEKLGAP